MGNTCVKSSSYRRATIVKKSPSFVSSGSTTPDEGMPEPLFSLEFVSDEFGAKSSITSVLNKCFCPNSNSFVVINPRTGIVILSVSTTGSHVFQLTTPDGRSLGSVAAKKTRGPRWFLQCDQLGYAGEVLDGVLRIFLGNQLKAEVSNDQIVSVQRGVDLVVVYLFHAINELLQCT